MPEDIDSYTQGPMQGTMFKTASSAPGQAGKNDVVSQPAIDSESHQKEGAEATQSSIPVKANEGNISMHMSTMSGQFSDWRGAQAHSMFQQLFEPESVRQERKMTMGGVIQRPDQLYRKFMKFQNAQEDLVDLKNKIKLMELQQEFDELQRIEDLRDQEETKQDEEKESKKAASGISSTVRGTVSDANLQAKLQTINITSHRTSKTNILIKTQIPLESIEDNTLDHSKDNSKQQTDRSSAID